MSPGGRSGGPRARARVPPGTRRRALVSGLVATLMLFAPLATGYGWLLHRSWRLLLGDGWLPAPDYFVPFPLQWPRMFVLAMFSVDVGLWVALVSLLPTGPTGADVFERTRLRLRRRWLITHAPLVPLVATLLGAHLHARVVASNGAGAAFFDAREVATGTRVAGAWIEGETLLLVSLAATFLVHLALLSGIVRPVRWGRNMLLSLAAAWTLATLATGALLPLGAGGLVGAARHAVSAVETSCPGLAGAGIDERIAASYSAFHRTAADAPALVDQPAWAVPAAVTLLVPLAWMPAAGFPVVLDGPPGLEAASPLPAGFERRVPRRGDPADLPLPDACAPVRVLKLDRALLATEALAALAGAGPGPARLGFAPAPVDPPRAPPPAPGPRLVLALGSRRPPADAPRAAVRVEDAGDPPPRSVENQARPRRGDPGRLHADRPPLPAPAVVPDERGRAVLDLEPGNLWFDVLRVIAAEVEAGAREIWLVPPGQSSASSSSR